MVWFLAMTVKAASVTLAWDASPDASVVGYKVYFGVGSGAYTNSVTVTNGLTCTITNLTVGVTYFFAATAYEINGIESDFSNEVSYRPPLPGPAPASGLRAVVAMLKSVFPVRRCG